MISWMGRRKGCFSVVLLPLVLVLALPFPFCNGDSRLSLAGIPPCTLSGIAAAASSPVPALGNAPDIADIAFGTAVPPRIAVGISSDIVASPVALVLVFHNALGIAAPASVLSRAFAGTFVGIVDAAAWFLAVHNVSGTPGILSGDLQGSCHGYAFHTFVRTAVVPAHRAFPTRIVSGTSRIAVEDLAPFAAS